MEELSQNQLTIVRRGSMSKTLITISTYQKSDALKVLLTSLFEHGYNKDNKIIVCDDNMGKSYEITKEKNPNHPLFKDSSESNITMPSVPEVIKEFEGVECVFGKKRGGISNNKNRGIKYFLDHSEYRYLLMLDDDIIFTAPGFIDLCIESKHHHLTGYLGDPANDTILFGEDRSPFFKSFPPQGGDPYIWYCLGSQGMMLWATRETVEEVGYMDRMKDHYGFEHSLWSNRIMVLKYKKFLDWFPVLKGCHTYFQSQSIPNNYTADYSQNQKYWDKRKQEIFQGIDLRRPRWQEP